MVIDSHLHLWEKQNGVVNGKPVLGIGGGKSDFGGEIRQMMPPYMTDDKNTIERLISNMNYAGVSGAVVTQEYIDGNQDEYLILAKQKYPDKVKICSLYEERDDFRTDGFDGVKICAGRLQNPDLTKIMHIFKRVEKNNMFLSIDLAEGALQVGEMCEIIKECPNLKIAIGHFGMVTKNGWEGQIKLAQNKNVYIESGGITWLFNDEFYPYPSAILAIKQAIEICGEDKLMWGSDYPRTMTAITYKMSLDFVQKTNELTQTAKDRFLGLNAKKFYGFEDLKVPQVIRNMVEN